MFRAGLAAGSEGFQYPEIMEERNVPSKMLRTTSATVELPISDLQMSRIWNADLITSAAETKRQHHD